jgi:hypothetical protein
LFCFPAGANHIYSYTVPNEITAIGDNAFCNCLNLVEICIHKDVGTIASNAAYRIRNKLGGGNTATDPVADTYDQRNEIARKIAEANKRGEALKRTRTC